MAEASSGVRNSPAAIGLPLCKGSPLSFHIHFKFRNRSGLLQASHLDQLLDRADTADFLRLGLGVHLHPFDNPVGVARAIILAIFHAVAKGNDSGEAFDIKAGAELTVRIGVDLARGTTSKPCPDIHCSSSFSGETRGGWEKKIILKQPAAACLGLGLGLYLSERQPILFQLLCGLGPFRRELFAVPTPGRLECDERKGLRYAPSPKKKRTITDRQTYIKNDDDSVSRIALWPCFHSPAP